VKRVLKPVTYVIAALYFLVDAAFVAIAMPISEWLARHVVLRRLRAWIKSLRPYPSLALFSVPVIILEPVKPVAAYLAATGQMVSSVVTLIIGELLKLVLVERLFSLTRDKLMKIPAFLWAYTKFRQAKAWLEATEAWQAIRAIIKRARQYVTELKKSAAMAFRQVLKNSVGPSRIRSAPRANSATCGSFAAVFLIASFTPSCCAFATSVTR